MMDAYLEKHDLKKNLHRFYAISVMPSLFGWSVVRRWGRIGNYGRLKIDLYDDLESAQTEFREKEQEKLRRGYQQVGNWNEIFIDNVR